MSDHNGNVVGLFIGLNSSSYEYIASIIAPYQQEYAPIVGGFMLIESINEYLVARIMDYVPKGEFMSSMGIKWLSDVALSPESIGQDIKTSKVSYQVKIKLLGRLDKNTNEFIPGIKTIPHITSKVVQPKKEIIEMICNKALEDQSEGIEIGEYWQNKDIKIHFNLEDLVGKRTFIFARAGYGKSNLMKVISSNWIDDLGSLIIFDPEGEYAVTDNKDRPGIMDKKPAILVTNRNDVNKKTRFNVYNKLKFDLRKFPPNFIIPILIPETKHEMIFFQKLMGLQQNPSNWSRLVDYLGENRWRSDLAEVGRIIDVEPGDYQNLRPILNNLIHPIEQLHDSESNLLDILEEGVIQDSIIIIDISLLNSNTALQLSSTIISHFFNRNQIRFTTGDKELAKVVFVVEEAQSVIGGKKSVSKFVELAKEGRKYQLGAIFITQQPGSISKEILSQGDNFFVFHLLSKSDLITLQKCNAHYSDDILTQILNEPIRGKSYMWTSNQPFVLPIHIKNFEDIAKANNSMKIQEENKILDQILMRIDNLGEIEVQIFRKMINIINDNNWDIQNRREIMMDDNKKKLCLTLFKLLDNEEIEYLNQQNGLAKNSDTSIPYSISYKYIGILHERARIHASSIEE
ncbi:MAG: ATP-binding protein [Candidatus Lokiarchaeota archaeon]|nr:ATP-binding protein [Candidatus Lokiarchaeota archaeon]